MPIHHSRVLWVAVLLVSFATTAASTTLVHRSPSQLAHDATLVVQGTVRSVTPKWNSDHTRILTEIDVDVEATHKGTPTTSVRVVQLGGVIEPIRMTVSGALRWRRDEEVLLFVEPADTGRYRVMGFNQGRFDIERGDRGPATVRRAALEGFEWRHGSARAGPDDVGTALRVPLQQFLQEVLGREDER